MSSRNCFDDIATAETTNTCTATACAAGTNNCCQNVVHNPQPLRHDWMKVNV